MKRRTFCKKLGGLLVIPIVGKELLNGETDGPGPPIIFTSNTKKILRVECTGNVGIGTTSPKLLLHVFNDIRML